MENPNSSSNELPNVPAKIQYVYSPVSNEQPPLTETNGNAEVESSVDSFITVSLVIFGVIMLFVPYGFLLAIVIFYFAFRTKNYKVSSNGNAQQAFEAIRKRNRAGLITLGVLVLGIAVFYGALINGLT